MTPAIVSLASIGAGSGGREDALRRRIENHPCYSEQAHHYFARMHVPVAPACNIQCNYCNRKYDCSNESRPGVVSRRLSPEEARDHVLAAAARLPQLSVVGIAGPGDPLANPGRTFRTLELVAEALPSLKLCLSTNGLALPDHVERIKALGVDHVTITINALDPGIARRIYAWIYFDKRRLTGQDAARILIERQLQGLDALVAADILVKVNSVLVPGVNDRHLPELNAELKARGAFLHNVMPLISRPEHGTAFGLAGQPEPAPELLEAVRERCTEARLMRHCRQCRADAVGLLGEDCAEGCSSSPGADEKARAIYRDFVDKERHERAAARERLLGEIAGASVRARIAVASKGGSRINQHFGHAKAFLVYSVDQTGARFVGVRRVDNYCRGGWGEDEAWPDILEALGDCEAVLVSKIGGGPLRKLEQAGIAARQDFALEFIEESLLRYFRDRYVRVRDVA